MCSSLARPSFFYPINITIKMKHIDNIELTPEQYHIPEQQKSAVAHYLHLQESDIACIQVLKRSLDSRRGVHYRATLEVYLKGEPLQKVDYSVPYQDVSNRPPVIIVGAGPAGLFAALQALQVGLKPIIIERGRPVEERKSDIARLARDHKVNPNSNWCFGEGGAGTYSDGKLYTRSTKHGDVGAILKQFVAHGADPEILIDAHGHIGTDKLSGIITNIRKTILDHGGRYHFGTKVVDFIQKSEHGEMKVCGVIDSDDNRYEGVAVILATGHSARDIYHLFRDKGWQLQAKSFAIGVRVEHPQALINSIQYHSSHPSPLLPPASYSLTTQVNGHGVFSFCMCPGGVIVPAATDEGQQVVNGMSDSRRSSPCANSGIAVTVAPEDVPQYASYGPLALLQFQQETEQRMFQVAQCIDAPSQRLTDFCEGHVSDSLNSSHYLGRCVSAPLHSLLPPFVAQCLRQGFRDFDHKMHGFYTRQANILAVESRTSSPVRIPRGDDMQHPQLHGLYPCGEGAGYAGGIVSSAIDGVNCMNKIAANMGTATKE